MAAKKNAGGEQAAPVTPESLGLQPAGQAGGAVGALNLDWARIFQIIQTLISLWPRQAVQASGAAGDHGEHAAQACLLDVARMNMECAAKALEHAQHHAPGE
jgi:hypothetical protein